MSEQPDKEGKTEHPSEKRLNDAFEKGNVPFSAEPGIFTSLLAMLAVGSMIASGASDALSQRLGYLLEKSGSLNLADGSDGFQVLLDEIWATFAIAAPVLILLTLGGLVGPLSQNVPQANLERITPKAQRLSPASNFKRIMGKQALVNFAKICFKVTLVSILVYWSISRELNRIVEASSSEAWLVPSLMLSIFNSILAPLCVFAALMAVADVLLARFNWLSDLKMTKQELKDEFKQMEGDPAIKAKIQQAARQRTRSRMMADLPRATVVIANPTHYAVALRYAPLEGGAPLVLAKGIDHLALRIRRKSEELGIAVVENKPLARSLHDAVDVGEMIPAEFYRAVAEVIHFVNMRDGSAGTKSLPV